MDYREIGRVYRGALDPGRLKIQADGFAFKSSKTGKVLQIKEADIDGLEWLRAARGYEVKVMMQDGNIAKFDGFKESDFADLKGFFQTQFRKELKEVEFCVKGWNWGEAKFRGSLLSFMVDSKPAFEIPLKEVSQVLTGKNEVTLEFHQNEATSVSLVEMRFHIPNTEGEEDPVAGFRDKALAHADIIQATGDAIVTFTEIQTLTPRGRYTIKAYPTFLQLHGKTFDYKIAYNNISRLFLLPHNDQRQMFFVLGLDPPIRQGQTRYYFVIFLILLEEDCEVSLTLTDDEIQERYEGKLRQVMSGTLYEVFSRVMRVLVGKKITVPGSFKTNNNLQAISCSNRATNGYLYPLDKGFIFVHKPTIYIKFEGIASVNFARMTGGAGVSRSFDFDVELKDGNVHHFSSMMKEDYGRLYEFVCDKHLRIKDKGGKIVHTVSYNDDGSSDSEHDAYRERMIAEGEERDSEDEDSDFVAGESNSDSDNALEFDSAASAESGSEGEEDGEPKPKRRKMEASKSTKRKKKEGGGKPSKKQKKDHNAPKQPLSAYMLWLQENRPKIKKKYPGLSLGEMSKKAGELWKALDDKSEWLEEAKRLRAQYKKDLARYKEGLTGSPTKSPTKSPAKAKAKAKAPKKGRGSEKYKSAEFVKSDEDSSSEDDDSDKESPPTPKKGRGSEKNKSAEFVKSDKDSSSEDDDSDEESPPTPPTKKGSSHPASRSMRSGRDEEQLVSLPSEGESDQSEGEAELTSGGSEPEDSESD